MFLSQIGIYFIVFVFCVLALRSPFIGLLGYYMLSFLRPQDIYWYSLGESRLSYYMAIVTIISALLHSAQRDKTVSRNNEFVWFYVLFWLTAVISYLMTTDKLMSYPFLILLSKLMLMALITILVVERIEQVKALLWMIVICLGILAVRSNYQYFYEGIWWAESPGQPGAPGRLDNNGYAMQFVMAIPIAFFLFFTEKRPALLKWGFPSTIPFMIHTIILTYSRGGFLGMILVLSNCVLFLKKRKWAILAAVLLFGVVMRLQGETSRQRLRTVYQYEEDPSVVNRFEAWRAGINMMSGNPWSGVGIGNFEMRSQEYNPVLTSSKAAHNAFLHIGGEMGLGAFTIYSIAIVLVIWRLWVIGRFYKRTANETPHYYYAIALRTALLGYVFCAMFLSLNYLELFYFMLAVVAAFVNIYRRDWTQYESSTAT